VPPSGLIVEGPLVNVTFRPHPADIELLASEGVAWEPIAHKMMIDTGAQLTVVEDAVPSFLHLVPIRFQGIAGVTGDLDCPVYRLAIVIAVDDGRRNPSEMQFSADVVAVPPVPELGRPHVGLLGRDFLSHVRFEYDGPRGEYRIIRDAPAGASPATLRDVAARKDRRRRERDARRKNRR
jgi:hypothetical protein